MRSSGILLHISSLPSKYGIGTLGKSAYSFIDFLKKSGQTWWQILPLGPTGYGNSPYQSFSAFAGNPYFIDLEMLCECGWLTDSDIEGMDFGNNPHSVDYGKIYNNRFEVLRRAFNRFKDHIPAEYSEFCLRNSSWLDSYASFMAQKCNNNCEWESEFHKVTQYFFYTQWLNLKSYAEKMNIKLIGDIPIYVPLDSADVRADASQFQLDENGVPTAVAGCPPDSFTEDGQLWGNPLYNWDKMKSDGYQWWLKRITHAAGMFDLTRIDHFRGFESYYSIPYGETTAQNGEWKKGPGLDFFKSVEEKLGKLPVIAEDLGFLTDDVRQLLEATDYPGMKVLEFGFDSRENSDYLPFNYPKNCVVYVGTHDNSTINGWLRSISDDDLSFATEYMRLKSDEGYNWGIIKTALATAGDIVILQMQDLLGLDDSARMNVPSTQDGNWQWRAADDDFSDELAEKLKFYTGIYRRLPINSDLTIL